MSKEIYISSTPHETRLAIVEHDELTEIYYERENEYTLAGSIYNGKVTRVLPGMQSSFVDVGLERDAFLYITDFMEEAGDSADFDTSENRGRSNGRRNDRGRDSQGNEGSTAADGQDRAFAEAADGAAAPARSESQQESRSFERNDRNDRTDRGDRNDRGRRRGRGGNRDVPAREARPAAEPPAGDSSPTDDRDSTPASSIQRSTPEPGNEADLGEGAPGADGSRRWRGRRGRRRGRSGNREGLPATQSATDLPGTEQVAFTPDPSSGYDLPEPFDTESNDSGYAGRFDLDASAAATPVQADPGLRRPMRPRGDQTLQEAGAESSPLSSPNHQQDRQQDRGSGQRESNDRGRRDHGGRGGRNRRDDRPRAPRGFAPSRALYGVHDAADQQATDRPPAEPIILPGESLSKYRQGGEAAQSASTPSTPAAAPDFTLPGAWDGGSVLPGETLRPRTSSSTSSSESRRDGRREGGRDGGQRDGRSDNRRGGRGSFERQPEASFAVAPVVPFRHEPAPVQQDADGLAVATPPEANAMLAEIAPGASAHELQAAQHDSQATPQELPSEAPASAPEAANVAPAEQEYEPTDASASHRFDPVPPREFRQPAPELEAVPEPIAELSALTHSITPPAGTPLAPLHSESEPAASSPESGTGLHSAVEQVAVKQVSETPLAQDLTSITPEGEMLSEAPPLPVTQEITEPTSPLQHETVILHAQADSQNDPQAAAETGSISAVHSADAPEISAEADDLIVEELAQDNEPESEEDFHTTTLHAASIEVMDYDDDEETLEGAADLGTMLREMSIDQITQPAEPATEEEEDDFAFEEEDSIEDGAFASPFEETAGRDPMGFTESDFAGEPAGDDDEEADSPRAVAGTDTNIAEDQRNDRRRGGRRDGRRGGRDRDRGGDRGRSSSPISSSASSDRDRSSGSRPGRRDGHRSAQVTNLPAISDLLKPGQEVLVQIAKEPIAKKGARITSHIALPGRFLVFMPTVNHTGVSRKIESDSERRRLKEILLSEKGDASGGFIVRTAASGASEEELRSDLRFLLNLWADIKQRSEASKSPALIYHDLNLVERILRDQVTDNFSAIWVDTESEYERVLRFLQRFQPSLIRRVKLYTKDAPLFEQFGITEEINKALRSKVWLKSGGSIVINQTEALVAIDINTGKFVGKTARLEDTIVKTNLDAIPEIVRQIRLRDLGGIIIIDFIDMDERKNRHKVMAVLEEELKKDRAPSKVLQFNDFGLVAITRKRVKQSLERTLSTTCGICAGTGMVKSAVTVCNDIYIEMRKMQKHLDRGDIMLRVNPEVVKQLKSPTAKWLQEMEEMVGKTILVKSDPTLHPEQFDIH